MVRRSKGLYRLLHVKAGLPQDKTEDFIRWLKKRRNPNDARSRREAVANPAPAAAPSDLSHRGYMHLQPAELTGASDAFDTCRNVLQTAERSGELSRAQAASPKPFLINVLKNEAILDHASLMELALAPRLVQIASEYIGSVPLLSAVRLWWTPPNTSIAESQKYHCDREDTKQLKVFAYVSEATPQTGPLTILPADVSTGVKARLPFTFKRYRFSDSEIEAAGGREPVVLTGPAGTAFCVDTSRCLHYGARSNVEPRLLLMLQYTDSLAPNVSIPDWRPRPDQPRYDFGERDLLVLGLQRS